MAAGPPLFTTIYDVIVTHSPALYPGTHAVAPGIPKLYEDVSRLLGVFALADMRHDFGRGADIFIVSAKKTIGQLFCDYVAAAFYAPASARYKELAAYLRETYDESLTSNKVAIAFFKSEMDDFFLNRFGAYRAAFTADAYVRYYDSCAVDTFDYDTPAKLNHILTVISPEHSRANQAILVDAMMGNPMEKIFNKGAGTQPNYLYNFASVMDAAPKAAADVHTYMKTLVQVNPTVPNIHRAYTSFGAQTDIVDFRQAAGIWETTAQITANDNTIRETFSVLHKASVNNMGLMLVRGKGAAGGAAGQVAGGVNIFEILVQHLFKSLGDRLQNFSVSRAGIPLINYMQVVDIKTGAPLAGSKAITAADKNILVFTNDEMNNYQLFMMRINSIYTGFATVTPYANQSTVPLKVEDVQKYFIDRAAPMHAALKAAPQPLLIVNTPDTIRATLHESLTRQRVLAVIAGNRLLALMKTKAPSADEIRAVITAANFGSYTNLMSDTIIDYLRRAAMPKEMSIKFIKATLAKYYAEASALNRALYYRQGAVTNDDYTAWFTMVNGLKAFFETLGLTPTYAYMAANAILCLYNNINLYLYKNGSLIKWLTKGADQEIVKGISAIPIDASVLTAYNAFIKAEIAKSPVVAAKSDTYLSIMCLRIVSGTGYEPLMKKVFEPVNVAFVSKERIEEALIAALPPEEIVEAPLPPPPPPPPQKKGKTKPLKVTKVTLKTKKTTLSKKTTLARKTRKTTEAPKPTKEAKRVEEQKSKLLKFSTGIRATRQAMLTKSRMVKKLTVGDYHPRAAHIAALLQPAVTDGEIEAYSRVGSDEPLGFFWRPVSAIREAYNSFISYIGGMAGGGTRTREREQKLVELCILKLNCMALNIQKSPVYAADLLAGSALVTTIMEDMKAIRSSKSRPVLLQSSLSRVEEEEGTQTGGTRTQTIMMVEPPKPKTHLVLHLKASKSAPDMTLASGTKVKILSGPQAKSLLEQRLAAFLWLGFNRSRETLRLEAEVSASLIGVDEFTADAHYDLFWASLFDFADKPYEYFAQKFEKGITTHFAGQSRSPLKRAIAKLKRNIVSAAHTRRYIKPA